MPTSEIFSLKSLCSLLNTSAPNSSAGVMWSVINALWPWYWLAIVPGLMGRIAFEIFTRNGDVHYNSENGFTPAFNRFVGSGTYFGLQSLIYFLLKLIIGEGVYCMSWPYALHAIGFASSGLLLFAVGFWPYLMEPGRRRKRKRRKF